MSILFVWVLASASIAFLSLTVFGVSVAQQQQLLTNQSMLSNGSNMSDQLNQSMQNNSSNGSDRVYSECLEIAAKSTCDAMFPN
jgi:hypothetical protein